MQNFEITVEGALIKTRRIGPNVNIVVVYSKFDCILYLGLQRFLLFILLAEDRYLSQK